MHLWEEYDKNRDEVGGDLDETGPGPIDARVHRHNGLGSP